MAPSPHPAAHHIAAVDIMSAPHVRAAVDAHAMAWFPKECCGLLVTGPDGHDAVLAHNGADRHAETSYLLDPAELIESRRRGETLVGIFHSHCRVGAYFSAEDKRRAITPVEEEPWFPGVDYVVLDAQDNGVRGYKVFRWADEAGDFIEQ